MACAAPAGKYCIASATSNTVFTSCPAGSWCAGGTFLPDDCTCDPGKYCAAGSTGPTVCTACPTTGSLKLCTGGAAPAMAYTVCATTGNYDGVLTAGTSSVDTMCKCATTAYLTNLSTAVRNDCTAKSTSCPAGTYYATAATATTDIVCVPCEVSAGFYAPFATTGITSTTPLATQCLTPVSTSCPVGTYYSNRTTPTSDITCTVCDGSYSTTETTGITYTMEPALQCPYTCTACGKGDSWPDVYNNTPCTPTENGVCACSLKAAWVGGAGADLKCNATFAIFVPLGEEDERRSLMQGLGEEDGRRSLAQGLSRGVKSFAMYNDKMYIGAQSYINTGVYDDFVAIWDGSLWQSFGGDGLSITCTDCQQAHINSLVSFKDKLYAFGRFKATVGSVTVTSYAAWDPVNSWVVPGGGTGSHAYLWEAHCSLVHNSILYVGFYANKINKASGDMNIDNILRFDGTTWLPRGNFGAKGAGVTAMIFYQDNIIVGGHYKMTRVGNTIPDQYDNKGQPVFSSNMEVNAIAAFNPVTSVWSALVDKDTNDNGLGFSGTVLASYIVNAFAIFNGDLIVGGNYDSFLPSNTPVKNIAKYSGTLKKWSVLGNATHNGVVGPVYALAVFVETLFVAGQFFQLGDGTSVGNIAMWSGTAWSKLILKPPFYGVNAIINSLIVHNDLLYLGGGFTDCMFDRRRSAA